MSTFFTKKTGVLMGCAALSLAISLGPLASGAEAFNKEAIEQMKEKLNYKKAD
ncbi:MAG: hypothetical protein BWY32_01978 [bacterium ADurb.Bin243]|nr:MAG: hypothetical protein BWY32_01978 [bacterium ADurb.Bin243]HOD40266.1 hypothetical protein [Candidatus Wallbacteria bacterium]